MKNLDRVYITLAAGAAILIVGAILFSMLHDARTGEVSSSPSPSFLIESPSPTPGATVTPVESPTPSPAASATLVPTMPESGVTFVANFYAAYSNSDRERLNAYFTEDDTAELASLRSRLFTGRDPQGNPGGPTLFATNSANQRVIGYTITRSVPEGDGWIVSVQEQRVTTEGVSLPATMTLLTLVPSTSPPGSWLVDAYTRSNEEGKYSAFLSE